MQSLSPTLTTSQLTTALEQIETLAQQRAAEDLTARKILRVCRKMRAQADAQAAVEYARMVVT